MENHQQHYHQVGGAINNDQKDTKRKLEDDSGKEAKKKEFRAKVDGLFYGWQGGIYHERC